MPNLGPASAPPALKLIDLIVDALSEIGVVAPGEQAQASDVDLCRRRVNLILDLWGARRANIFNVSFQTFTLQAGHQPHTIGPGGDFDVQKRPVSIIAAQLLLSSSTPNVGVPLGVRDDSWWARQTLKGLTSTLPTDLYYSPDFPLGNIYLWPVPTAVNKLEIQSWLQFSEFAKADEVFQMPQGYRAALMLELALSVFPSFWPSKQPNGITVAAHQAAKRAIQGNNLTCDPARTTDAGMPSSSGGKPDFNFLTGQSK